MFPKKLIIIGLFFVSSFGFSQTVSINDEQYSPPELVNVLLENSCLEISNVELSSTESVAYFNNQGGVFPIAEGIIIRSGVAEFSEGIYTDLNLSSQLNENGDAYLEQLNMNAGQSSVITDVAFLQFNFVPLSTDFSFNFLFASNEYGEWQCVSSDIFAFLLTDLTTGTTTNLAIIPGTLDPVSVRNIKDAQYNSSCQSDNPDLFSTYNVDDPNNSTINMRGRTVVMNASSNVIVGNSYQIRLVIGDSQDALYDSAIFLEAGSFTTNVELGPDRTICDGDVQSIQTNLDPTIYLHTWTKNGVVLPGETGNTLLVNTPATYGVSVVKENTTCLLTDEVVFSDLMVQTPPNLLVCDSGGEIHVFDLTNIDPTDLGLDNTQYELVYYATLNDIDIENPIPTSDLTSFESPSGETVYVKIRNLESGIMCNSFYSFDLLVSIMPEASQPDDLEICQSGSLLVNLSQVAPQILASQNPSDFNLLYFISELDAEESTNIIENPEAFSVPENSSPLTIWVRMEYAQNPDCFDIVSFELIIHPKPLVDELPDVIECDGYLLPPLENGNYFTEANAAGEALFAGETIDTAGIYYIFSGPNEFGCINQSSFEVFLAIDYLITGPFCGEFSVPIPQVGAFYDQPGGPLGGATLIPPGTILTTSQTIYYYVEIEGEFCRDDPFDIEIISLPLVDAPEDVVTCNQYILPTLTVGNYFSQPDGTGSPFFAGDVISSSQDIYVFEDDGICDAQAVFHVFIVPEFPDIESCGEYQLPFIEMGGYFTEPLGAGEEIPQGTIIETEQTVYYYVETTTQPNCTDNLSFHINVINTTVDEFSDVLLCEGDLYELPPLVNGEYFTETQGGGLPLFPGDLLSVSQIVYIFAINGNCTAESSFFVEIRHLPLVDHFTDVYACEPYQLPVLENGAYYTEPGGNGEQLPAGTMINWNQLIYIYNAYDDFTSCFNQDEFNVYFNGIDVGVFEDVAECNQYILPSLTIGNYFTDAAGEGTQLFPGDVITSDQEIFVYAENGERFVCTDEASFFVDISTSPVLNFFQNVESCGSFILPTLSQEFYNVGYYFALNGQDEITNLSFDTPGSYSIYVFATAFDNPDCTDQTMFTLSIYPLLNLQIEDGVICQNLQTGEVDSPALLVSGLDSMEFTVNWYYQGILVHAGPEYAAYEPGTYTVETIKLNPVNGAECNYAPTTVEVFETALAVATIDVSQPFSEIAVINVTLIDGLGTYEYQLDEGPFQSSSEFYDVESGLHTVTIRSLLGNCGTTVLEAEVFKYPKFFTPNGDGYNETWNIVDLYRHPEAKIFIFDRYGKLLTTFGPKFGNWDGSYHGKPMPPNEYWFKVEYLYLGEQKVFKSHFSLIR